MMVPLSFQYDAPSCFESPQGGSCVLKQITENLKASAPTRTCKCWCGSLSNVQDFNTHQWNVLTESTGPFSDSFQDANRYSQALLKVLVFGL